MAQEITDLHTSYSTTVESILSSPKFSSDQNITTISQSVNLRFDNVQGMVKRLTEQLKEEQKMILKEIDDAVVEIAKEDCWWEGLNIFSYG